MSHRLIIVRCDSQTLSYGCNPAAFFFFFLLSFVVLFPGAPAFTSTVFFHSEPGVMGLEGKKKKKILKIHLFCQTGLWSTTHTPPIEQDKQAADIYRSLSGRHTFCLTSCSLMKCGGSRSNHRLFCWSLCRDNYTLVKQSIQIICLEITHCEILLFILGSVWQLINQSLYVAFQYQYILKRP